MAAGSEVEPADSKEKGKRYTLDDEDLLFLSDLDLPVVSATTTSGIDAVKAEIRVAKSNRNLKALFLSDKSQKERPAVLQGRESTIKSKCLETVSKQTLGVVVKALREGGDPSDPLRQGLPHPAPPRRRLMLRGLAIRACEILHALNPKPRPGSCPPSCSEMHTFRWPCRVYVSKSRQREIARQVEHHCERPPSREHPGLP